ncbi:shikimate dehydrogenase [candidate division MSBL1 archaeon SCGC-AAA382F02]|uniref:Shikimate dehydrogenase (NADP(+)) n=1 Tax=candidate division MSBL1 archaeon SCGC-AAA382F02 TaxID=1698282 RepID=A0A133VJA5_9EURY|nr:shikimate dehydrogenase [candidate division MSBL1 archaeon SCGC-AAA382F02]
MISSQTKLVGLIGNPIKHSISPAIQNAAFKESDLDFIYTAFNVEKDHLSEAIGGIKALGIKGANVTIPHKTSIINYLDELDDLADKIGAVNTIKREKDNLKGYNTDGIGALRALKGEVEKIENKNVLLLGAGGAARAIAFTLVGEGANLTLSNRTESKAENLSSEIEKKTNREVNQVTLKEESLEEEMKNCEILINSTSVGMHPNEDETLVTSENMHDDLTVMDIVYNPLQTKLLQEAEKIGANTINGLEMLIQQGAASFEIWTGKKPSIETMKKAGKKALEEK